MTNENKTWVAGLVGVAVGATLAVLIFLVSQPSASRDQATGAIGAAERYRSEQIQPGDTGIAGAVAPTGAVSTTEVAVMLGRAAAERQAWVVDRASPVLANAMWENATAAERASWVARLDSGRLNAILERLDAQSRIEFQKAMSDRVANDQTIAQAYGRMRAEESGKVSADLASAMWENATAAERASWVARLDSGRLNAVVNRVDAQSRIEFQDALAERAAPGRVASQVLLEKVSVATWEKASPALASAMLENATAAERASWVARLDSGRLNAVVNRVDAQSRIEFQKAMSDRVASDRAIAEAYGRVRAEESGKVSADLANAMWENATAAERASWVARLDSGRLNVVLDRFDAQSRIEFQKAMSDRVASDRAIAEAYGRMRAEESGKVSADLASAMWESASPLEKVTFLLKADAVTQNKALERMDENGRVEFQRMLSDRAFQDRISAQRVDPN